VVRPRRRTKNDFTAKSARKKPHLTGERETGRRHGPRFPDDLRRTKREVVLSADVSRRF
jgi:hypothetical protein